MSLTVDEYGWVRDDLAGRATPISLAGDAEDLARSVSAFAVLDGLAARARIAFVGEMDHFVAEKYDYRLLLCVRYLASRGWGWFGEELPAARGRRAEAYLRSGDDTLLDPVDEPPWFASGPLANQRQPTAALDAAHSAFLRTVRAAVPQTHWFGFDADSSDEDYLGLANAATDYDQLRPAMARREQIMQSHVARVLAEHPGEKVALFGAAAHLLKDGDTAVTKGVGAGPGGDQVHSLGHYVGHDLTDEPVLAVWMLHGEGRSDNPWLPAPGRLRPPRGTLDAQLLRRLDESALITIDGDRRPRRITVMHNLVMRCCLAEQVDALVFVPHVRPLSAAAGALAES